MRKAMLMLATLGVLCFAANQVQAHEYYHGRYHGGYRAPVVVRTPVLVRPTVVVPAPVYPQVLYPPVYGSYRYPYYSGPSYGFYYQGRGLSIGVGF